MSTQDPHAIGADQEPPISDAAFASLIDMIGPDMPEVVIDLLDTYLDESATLVGRIQDALAHGNEAEMLRPAHSLKSSSASIGALRLSALCAQLEDYMRHGEDALDVPAQVQLIRQEFGRVQQAIEVRKAELRAQ